MSELKMPTCLGLLQRNELKKLREIGSLERICRLRPTYPPQGRTEDTPFTTMGRHGFVRGRPVSLKSSVVILVQRPYRTVVTVPTELGGLSARRAMAAAVGTVMSRFEQVHISRGTWEAAVELAMILPPIPVSKDHQKLFAFSGESQQYTFAVLLQAYTLSNSRSQFSP